ncbi:hypothetical protein [Leptolyngbya sp. FACHB-711]|uniref:hypothetical protein n=1 Tax=Leptolyngbya sp. FACHB-711 TaxID=2692813 RepID=UPI001688A8F3|nr:hypothetical protein [Leptolyngbya sp. FACHB-711]MBD2025261.1 hypothetical protein [Leptolyngbya sp. FACHB-711]
MEAVQSQQVDNFYGRNGEVVFWISQQTEPVADTESRIKELESQIPALRSEIWELRTEVANLRTNASSLESKFNSINQSVSGSAVFLVGCFCALWAQNTRRNPWLWFFFGMLLSPISLLVLLSKNSADQRR